MNDISACRNRQKIFGSFTFAVVIFCKLDFEMFIIYPCFTFSLIYKLVNVVVVVVVAAAGWSVLVTVRLQYVPI